MRRLHFRNTRERLTHKNFAELQPKLTDTEWRLTIDLVGRHFSASHQSATALCQPYSDFFNNPTTDKSSSLVRSVATTRKPLESICKSSISVIDF